MKTFGLYGKVKQIICSITFMYSLCKNQICVNMVYMGDIWMNMVYTWMNMIYIWVSMVYMGDIMDEHGLHMDEHNVHMDEHDLHG